MADAKVPAVKVKADAVVSEPFIKDYPSMVIGMVLGAVLMKFVPGLVSKAKEKMAD